MCSVYGAIVNRNRDVTRALIETTFANARERGRDSWGLVAVTRAGVTEFGRSTTGRGAPEVSRMDPSLEPFAVVGSRRAEPTTEWVHEKSDEDVQPFESPGGWVYTHNGTISNDRELLERLREEPGFHEPDTRIDAAAIGVALDCLGWERGVRALEGSFAIVAAHRADPGVLLLTTNYKPIFVHATGGAELIQVSSQPHFFPTSDSSVLAPRPVELPPYSIGRLTGSGELEVRSLYPKRTGPRRVLAVCSGGLDSVVAAWRHHVDGDDVTLLHFDYHCQAGPREQESTRRIAERIGCPVVVIDTDFFAVAAQSALTDPDGEIRSDRGGETGAELGQEWIPARNTVLLALALAYAEAHGFDTITIGTNLEESGGGYPDNEQEFVNKVQGLTPYALKPYHQLEISQPCGTLMKHEIVKLGHDLGAPLELTWSCYRGGDAHCGRCGPCWMRQVGHLMNGLVDPVFADRWDEIEREHEHERHQHADALGAVAQT